MRHILRFFHALVIASALLILWRLSWTDILAAERSDIAGVLALVSLGVASEFLRIHGQRVATSIAFVPLFACALLFPPGIAIPAAAAIEGAPQFVINRRRWWLALFNTSQSILAIAGATAVLRLVSGQYWTIPSVQLAGFLSFVLVAFAINLLLVSSYVALSKGASFAESLRSVAGPRGSNTLYGLLASPVALITAILYREFHIAGLLLILLPLIVIRYSYQAQRKLEQANRNLLRVLIKAIETRDPYTSGHSIRVSTLARTIAEDMALPTKRAEAVETAALLHDIGKIDSIYAPIIQKTSDLTPEERKTIQTHAVKGAELLADLGSFNDDIIAGVRHHHERYDGTGYPHGLAGKTIPIAGRIIMICDSIDAMLSDRPYRRALSIDQVHAELIRCSGTQFDPDIADTIIRLNTLERARDLVASHSIPGEKTKVFQIA